MNAPHPLARSLHEADWVILDGTRGVLELDPDPPQGTTSRSDGWIE